MDKPLLVSTVFSRFISRPSPYMTMFDHFCIASRVVFKGSYSLYMELSESIMFSTQMGDLRCHKTKYSGVFQHTMNYSEKFVKNLNQLYKVKSDCSLYNRNSEINY